MIDRFATPNDIMVPTAKGDSMSGRGKKWIVGLDLRPLSQGAIRFAAWMASRSQLEGAEQLIGIHVIEEDHLRAALRYHHYDEVMKAAQEAAEQTVTRLGLENAFSDVHVVQGVNAEKSLEAARTYHHAHGIIMGRYAHKEGVYVRRLGRVARRVLRQLSSPVIVVPPDWESPEGEAGPVLAACNLQRECGPALRFAIDMGERLDRQVTAVHVVPLPEDYGAHYLPEGSLERLRVEHQQEGEQGLSAFLKDENITGVRSLVVQGGTVEHLCEQASIDNASLLVTGSRRLSMFDRVLLTSIGSELAANAACPVAVVPPGAVDQTPG